MPHFIAKSAEAEPLLAPLEQFAAIEPPPWTVEVSVMRGEGGLHRFRQLKVGRDTLDQAWLLGTLAHEYAHIIDPQSWAGLVRQTAQRGAMVIVALAVMAGLGLAELPVWPAATAAIVLMIWVLLGVPAAMRAQELRADRRAVELLGERAGSLELMLERIADEDGGRWSWFRRLLDDHPHPAKRLARVRTQLTT